MIAFNDSMSSWFNEASSSASLWRWKSGRHLGGGDDGVKRLGRSMREEKGRGNPAFRIYGEAMRMSHEAPLDCRKFRIASAFAQVKIALVSHLGMVGSGPIHSCKFMSFDLGRW